MVDPCSPQWFKRYKTDSLSFVGEGFEGKWVFSPKQERGNWVLVALFFSLFFIFIFFLGSELNYGGPNILICWNFNMGCRLTQLVKLGQFFFPVDSRRIWWLQSINSQSLMLILSFLRTIFTPPSMEANACAKWVRGFSSLTRIWRN